MARVSGFGTEAAQQSLISIDEAVRGYYSESLKYWKSPPPEVARMNEGDRINKNREIFRKHVQDRLEEFIALVRRELGTEKA